MTFNSMHFLVFFPLVTIIYFLIPGPWRWCWLVPASFYFYMCWRPEYILLFLLTTVVDYAVALKIFRTDDPVRRWRLLLVSLCSNLGVLFIFKYANFAADSLRTLSGWFNLPLSIPHINVVLPVGISFYTFQSLSYTIDVYRRVIPAEPHLGRFTAFTSFYPQLVAGPINRAADLLPQMKLSFKFDADRVLDGLQTMAWGFFKKVVIADRLAVYVNTVYNNVPGHTGPTYLLATYLFALQIYCDFSGYSDIAIGAARVMGFRLMENFRRPYFATTIVDFWRRWHISLSTWLRDYLYISLGGNRFGTRRTYINLLITMLLGGIWHGAAWTFVIWGALQGIMLCVSKATLPYRDRVVAQLGIPQGIVLLCRGVVTFHLVCLSWVFFRANSLADAVHVLTHIADGWPKIFLDMPVLAQAMPAVVVLLIVQIWQTREPVRNALARWPLPVRWAAYYAVLFSIILLGVDGASQFIYFQF